MKNKKIVWISAAAILVAVIIAVAALIGTVSVIKHMMKWTVITEQEQYGKYEGAFSYDPVLFPKTISGLDVVEYKYKHREGPLDPDDQYILLTVKYSEKEFEKELKRISLVKAPYTEPIKYNDKDFEFPAYVAHLNDGHNSEFALVDDEKNEIHYVYVQFPPDFEGEKYINRVLLDQYEESLDLLPKGELKKTVSSPDGKYKLKLYLCNGGATVDYAVRGEIVNESKEKWTIYWNYHCEDFDASWKDDKTVVINGKKLNIFKDRYDWRDE